MYSNFRFGIYPGGEAGGDDGLLQGPADDPTEIVRCLDELQGDGTPLVVRAYERFSDRDNPSRWTAQAPPNYEHYLGNGRKLDLVIMFQSIKGDVPSFLEFARDLAMRHADRLYSIQVTEEANFHNGPDAIDGPYPNVLDALVEGISAVKGALRAARQDEILVGFNSTPTFGENAKFWERIRDRSTKEFCADLDYVGLDFFPDVFRRADPDGAPGDFLNSARSVLEAMREVWLPLAGIAKNVPIHVAEHGWPTGPDRPFERQAQIIDQVIGLIWARRHRLNIARYTLFGLRDADSTSPGSENDFFRHFGVTTDDYRPKPAYFAFRDALRKYQDGLR